MCDFCFDSAMRTGNANTLPITKLVGIKFNVPVAVIADADNEARRDDRRPFNRRVWLTRVEIKQNVARLRAFAWADDATVLRQKQLSKS